MRKTTKKIASMILAGAMVVTSAPVTSEAATATVKLNKTKATITAGKTVKLTVSKKNVSSTNKVSKIKKTTWKSLKTSVATVSGGTVKGVKKGTAKIQCTVKYTVKKGKKTTSKSKKLTCTVTVKAKQTTPTQAPASQAPASGTPASQAPASEAPASGAPASQAPASGAPASGTPASGTPASQAPASGAPASTAPTASASAAPSASASAAPTASASAAPSVVPATAAPSSATATPSPTPIAVDYSGTQFKFAQTTQNATPATATEITLEDLFVYETKNGVKTKNADEKIEIRISKVGDEAKSESTAGYGWSDAEVNGGKKFTGLASGTKYTFAARVKATGTHKAGEIDTLEVSTTGTKITVEGLKWGKPVTAGETLSGKLNEGDDDATGYINKKDISVKNANTGVAITGNNVAYTYTLDGTLNAPTKNTKAVVKVEVKDGTNTIGIANVELVALVKAATPSVKLVYALDDTDGYVEIARVNNGTTIPAGLQYTKTSSASDNTSWKDVTSLTIKSGKVEASDKELSFRIADTNKSAVGGWTGSGSQSATTLVGNELYALNASDDVSTTRFEVNSSTITLKSGKFTVSNTGDTALDKNLIISGDAELDVPSDNKLKIAANKTITVNGKLTNNGTITNDGTYEINGTVTNKANSTWTNENADPFAGNGSMVYEQDSTGKIGDKTLIGKNDNDSAWYKLNGVAQITLKKIADGTPNMILDKGTVTAGVSAVITDKQIAEVRSGATLDATAATALIGEDAKVIVDDGATWKGSKSFPGKGSLVLKAGAKGYIGTGENSFFLSGSSGKVDDLDPFYVLTSGQMTLTKIVADTPNIVVEGNLTVNKTVKVTDQQTVEIKSGTLGVKAGEKLVITAGSKLRILTTLVPTNTSFIVKDDGETAINGSVSGNYTVFENPTTA